jgi:hypothetical protein
LVLSGYQDYLPLSYRAMDLRGPTEYASLACPFTRRMKRKQVPKHCGVKNVWDYDRARDISEFNICRAVTDISRERLIPRLNAVVETCIIRGMVRTLAASAARGWCFGSGMASLSVRDLLVTTRRTSRLPIGVRAISQPHTHTHDMLVLPN